jgi:hypothetical protein
MTNLTITTAQRLKNLDRYPYLRDRLQVLLKMQTAPPYFLQHLLTLLAEGESLAGLLNAVKTDFLYCEPKRLAHVNEMLTNLMINEEAIEYFQVRIKTGKNYLELIAQSLLNNEALRPAQINELPVVQKRIEIYSQVCQWLGSGHSRYWLKKKLTNKLIDSALSVAFVDDSNKAEIAITASILQGWKAIF